MKQQYKKVPNSWQYIRRFDEPEKTLAEKSINILSVAMYQINKYGQAILTHRVLKEITGRQHDQNRRLIKQLGFIFHFKFSRFLIESNKRYNDAYQLTLKKSALEILENPKKYFANYTKNIAAKDGSKNLLTSQQNDIEDHSKNAATSQQKCSDVTAKMLRSPESLHIYNKNKDKIKDKINSNQNHTNQNPLLEKKVVETTEPKIANSEYAEKSHNGVAREESAYTTQAKKQAAEPVENGYSQLGEPILLLNYVFTDAMLLEAIKASDKKHYTPKQVKVILRNLLEKYPGKIIFGGNRGFIKYLIKVINGEIDYEYQAKYHLSKLDKATTMAEIQAEKQKAIDERFQLLLQGKVKSLSRAEEYYG